MFVTNKQTNKQVLEEEAVPLMLFFLMPRHSRERARLHRARAVS
jgi:hypothetical protein